MKFCKHCGDKIKDDAKFCNHCGEKVEFPEQIKPDLHNQDAEPKQSTPFVEKADTEEANQADLTENNEKHQKDASITGGTSPVKTNQNKKKMSPKTKLIIGILAFIVIAFIVVFKVGESMYAPNKTAEKFNEAVRDNDVSAVKKLLISEEDDLKIDKESVQSMLDYLDDNSEKREIITKHIEEQGERLTNDESTPSIFEEDVVFNLEKDGKFLVYDQYKVAVSPVYFELSTNYKDTELFVNEKSVGKSKKEYYTKKVGPYLPGTYEFEAKHKSNFAELETNKTVDNFDKERVPVVDLSVKGQSVTFDLPFYDELDSVNLIMNGKDTKINLVENSTVKPMKTGKNVKAAYEAEFPWGKMRSGEFIVDSTYPRAGFQVDEDLQKELKKLIIQSEKEQFETITSGGKETPSKMVKDTAKELKERSKKDAEDGIKYKFQYLGSDFDTSSYLLTHQDDQWQIEVKTTSHRKEEAKRKSDSDKDDFKETEKTKRYTLAYDEKAKEWLVKAYDNYGSPDSKSLDKHREKKPKTFESK